MRTRKSTYGYRRAEVLAAAAQAAVLLVVGGFVLVEGIERLVEPSEIASGTMVVFGVVGWLTIGRAGTAGRCGPGATRSSRT